MLFWSVLSHEISRWIPQSFEFTVLSMIVLLVEWCVLMPTSLFDTMLLAMLQ